MKFEPHSQMFLLITPQFSQINIENIKRLLKSAVKIYLLTIELCTYYYDYYDIIMIPSNNLTYT